LFILLFFILKIIIGLIIKIKINNGDWGLGIGDWGLGRWAPSP
jgi:hypothetical protein